MPWDFGCGGQRSYQRDLLLASVVGLGFPTTDADKSRSSTEAGAHVIKRRLRLDPGEFWRAARGHDFLDLPKRPVQMLLFHDDAYDAGR